MKKVSRSKINDISPGGIALGAEQLKLITGGLRPDPTTYPASITEPGQTDTTTD